jgi:uncharacterized protein
VQFQTIIPAITLISIFLLGGCGGPTFRAVEVTPEGKPVSSGPAPAFDPSGLPAPPTEPKPVTLDGFQRLEWKTLRGLDVKSGKTSADLSKLNGANVRIQGFMVPFDDDVEEVTEFLLVPQAGMCIHTPAPPANQIIMVEVGTGGANRVEWDKEVFVYGQFQIVDGDSPYGKTGFKVSAVRARPE